MAWRKAREISLEATRAVAQTRDDQSGGGEAERGDAPRKQHWQSLRGTAGWRKGKLLKPSWLQMGNQCLVPLTEMGKIGQKSFLAGARGKCVQGEFYIGSRERDREKENMNPNFPKQMRREVAIRPRGY